MTGHLPVSTTHPGQGHFTITTKTKTKAIVPFCVILAKMDQNPFAVWSKGTSYDEALHIQNLKAKNVPWAMAL